MAKGKQKIACYTTVVKPHLFLKLGFRVCVCLCYPGLWLWGMVYGVVCMVCWMLFSFFFRIENIMYSTNRSMTCRHRMKNQKTHTVKVNSKHWTVQYPIRIVCVVCVYVYFIDKEKPQSSDICTLIHCVWYLCGIHIFHHCRMFWQCFHFTAHYQLVNRLMFSYLLLPNRSCSGSAVPHLTTISDLIYVQLNTIVLTIWFSFEFWIILYAKWHRFDQFSNWIENISCLNSHVFRLIIKLWGH